jgi:aryl-alcohol dehydrogenase-like predicted oxidoreductase
MRAVKNPFFHFRSDSLFNIEDLKMESFYFAFSSQKSDACMKNTDHPSRHPYVHLDDQTRAEAKRVYVKNKDKLAAAEELGIGFVPFSPLGRGFLTGKITEDRRYQVR